MIGIGTPPVDDGDDRPLLVQLVRDGRGGRPRAARRRPRPARRGPRRAAAGRPSRCRAASRSSRPLHLGDLTWHGAGHLRLLLRVARGRHLDHRRAARRRPRSRSASIDQPLDRGRTARCSTCCTASPTTTPPGCATPRSSGTPPPRGLAVVMPRGRAAASTPTRRTATATGPTSPRSCRGVVGQFFRVSQEPRGHLRRRPLDGRLRRAQAGAAPTPSGSPRRPPCPGRLDLVGLLDAARPSRDRSTGSSATSLRPDDDLFDAARRRPTPTSCRRCTSRCGTEDPLLIASSRRFVDAAAAGRRGRHHRLPARRARVGALGRDDPGRHRLAAGPRRSLG